MKVLLLFLLLTVLMAARATRKGREMRVWPLLIASFLVGASFYSLSVI
jgi:hypothetical protein